MSNSSDLLLVTGAPLDSSDDRLLGDRIRGFSGAKIVCGGTTAKIVARELGVSVTVVPNSRGVLLPPASRIAGVDIVSEGAITLGFVRDLLTEIVEDSKPQFLGMDSRVDKRIVKQLLSHRRIALLVGTKLNQAHFDPSLPVVLERRVDLMSDIARILEQDFRKHITVEYL